MSKNAQPGDPRHQPVMDAIAEEYRAATGLPAPLMARTASALARFLRENPAWPGDRLVAAVRNRFKSDNVNYAEPPWAWIEYLPSYATGPLDRFSKVKQPAGPAVRQPGGQWSPEQIAEILRKQAR